MRRLDNLGVDWGVSKEEKLSEPIVSMEEAADTAWDVQFSALTKFKKVHGHTMPEVVS
jgi:hypothetical protein